MAAAGGRDCAAIPLLRRGLLLHARPQGALRRARTAGFAGCDHRRVPVPAQHRPGARPVAHMTRSGMSPRLALHCVEPFVEVHPADARAAGLSTDGFARVTTRHGEAILKVVVSDGQRPGSLFVPIHWSDVTAAMARVGDLVGPATDPHSGQPEAKATPAAVAPVAFASRGFVLARRPVTLPPGTWWARVAVTAGSGYWLATNDAPATWQQTARRILGERAELAEYVDAPRGLYRAAAFAEGRLDGCIF